MDAGIDTVFLPAEIQIVSEPIQVDELLEPQQTVLTTVDEIDWEDIPITIGPAITIEAKEADDEVIADFQPQSSGELLATDEFGTTEYVLVETDFVPDSDVSQTSAPCFLFPDGTVKCIEEVVLLEEEEEDALNKPQRPKNFVCQVEGCGRAYSSQHHLKAHERIHTGEKPYKCPYDGCNKEFIRDFSLKSHIRIHTGERPYACSFCRKSFKTSGDLHKHIRTHTGERPFLCPVQGCEKSFTTSNTCRIHLRTHTGEKPYICQEEGCDKEFSSSTNYKNHLRIHSGERPYACTVEGCDKRFTEYSSLYKHRLVHSQAKRYKCGYCDKAYRQMTTLTTHKRAVHGVVMSEDGSELLLEQMMGSGEEGVESFKDVTTNIMSLKGVSSITFHDEGSPLYVFSETDQ